VTAKAWRPEIEALELTGISRIALPHMDATDILPLWFGESDSVTPEFIRDAAKKALDDGHTFYDNARGRSDLRSAIKRYCDDLYGVNIEPGRISTPGATMLCCTLAVQIALGRGDHAIVISPFWPNIERSIRVAGAAQTFVRQKIVNGKWHLDIDEVIAAITPATRMIYLNSPCNPTGWVMGSADQQRLLDICRERNVLILSDEVYHRHVYDRNVAPSFLDIALPDDPVVVVNGFSKAWAMTGWRLGWMITPAYMAEQMTVLAQAFNTGSSTFSQAGGIAALDHGEPTVAKFKEQCSRNRDLIFSKFESSDRIELAYPDGAFYAFPRIRRLEDSMKFAEQLVESERVGVSPGYTFGPGNEDHVRLSLACSTEMLDEALDRFSRFVDTLDG